MARDDEKDIPKAEVDKPPQPTPPRTRDELVAENRQRKQMQGEERKDPADVPAGPGDAGAQDEPRQMKGSIGQRSGGWGRASVILAALLLVALAIVILF